MPPDRAARILRAKTAELEARVLNAADLDDLTALAADIALVANLLADHLADHLEVTK